MNKNKTLLNSSILLLFIGFFLFFILISAAHAGCPEIRLYATNKTPVNCVLAPTDTPLTDNRATNPWEEHGDIGHSDNENIDAGVSEHEYGRGDQSTSYGPHFHYWFLCGGWQLYVEMQKNFCSFASGDIDTYDVVLRNGADNI